jgi:hypothetical protein
MKTLAELPALDQLAHCPLNTRIWFEEESQPYRVRARSSRYLVCTKPFNPKHTVLYTIVDLVENVRGPENLVFGMGAESDEDCVAMIERLHGITRPLTAKETAEVKTLPRNLRRVCQPLLVEPTEVSHRHRIDLKVARVALS